MPIISNLAFLNSKNYSRLRAIISDVSSDFRVLTINISLIKSIKSEIILYITN